MSELCPECPLANVKDPQSAREWAFSDYIPGSEPSSVPLSAQDLAVKCLTRYKRGSCAILTPTDQADPMEQVYGPNAIDAEGNSLAGMRIPLDVIIEE